MTNEATVVVNNETVNEETGEVIAIVDEPVIESNLNTIITDIKIFKKIFTSKDKKEMSIFYINAEFYGGKVKEVSLSATSVKTATGSIADRQFFIIMNDIFNAGKDMFLTLTPYEFKDKKGFQYGVCVKDGSEIEFQMNCSIGSASDKAVLAFFLKKKNYLEKI